MEEVEKINRCIRTTNVCVNISLSLFLISFAGVIISGVWYLWNGNLTYLKVGVSLCVAAFIFRWILNVFKGSHDDFKKQLRDCMPVKKDRSTVKMSKFQQRLEDAMKASGKA